MEKFLSSVVLSRGVRWIAALALGPLVAAGAVTQPAAAASTPCWPDALSDVDGGGPDAIVGMPSYDLPGKPDAGAIVVYSNVGAANTNTPKAPAARRLLTADDFDGLAAQAGARFGASVLVWGRELGDPDNCADLLVGAPGQNVAGKASAGRAYFLHGSPDGLGGVRGTFDEATLPNTGGAEAGAQFGAAMAAQSSGILVIGAPGADRGSVVDAGEVVVLDYSSPDPAPAVSVLVQGLSGAGLPEVGDRFGEALEVIATGGGDVIVVGVPHEDVGSKVDAGAVAYFPPGGPLSMVTQDSPGAGGVAEAGDRYGADLDVYGRFTTHPVGQVVIGVPGEDVGSRQDAGAIAFASFDFDLEAAPDFDPIVGNALVLTQDSAGIPGSVETGDAFGASIVTAELGNDDGVQKIAAGSPGEDLGKADGGMVTMTRVEEDGTPRAGTQPGPWSQDASGVSGVVETGDRFGSRMNWLQLARPDDDFDLVFSILFVTVPGEDLSGVRDAGTAYLGAPPGRASIALTPPVLQAGAGTGMVPMALATGEG